MRAKDTFGVMGKPPEEQFIYADVQLEVGMVEQGFFLFSETVFSYQRQCK
jgi:hypothetical protein